MRHSDQLAEFTRDALKAGHSRADIQQALRDAGWDEQEIRQALAAWVDSPFSPPIPHPRPQLSAREAFFYLLLFGTLGWTAWHMTTLLFHAVDAIFSDDTIRPWIRNSIRFSTASLIVTTPVFVWLHMRLSRDIAAAPGKRRSLVRKWLGYLAMFAAAGIILGDLVSLVYRLLQGALSMPFAIKSAILAIIATAIIGYFRNQIGRDDDA